MASSIVGLAKSSHIPHVATSQQSDRKLNPCMPKPAPLSLLWGVLIAAVATVRPALSQSLPEPVKTTSASEAKPEHSEEKAEHESESHLPEADFAASTVFRSGALIQPLLKHVNFEGYYFGGGATDIGVTGGSYKFHGKSWSIDPGMGVAFGGNGFRTMPALTVRLAYERGWFIAEGMAVYGLLHTTFASETEEAEETEEPSPKSVVPLITDGDHVSVRWRRLTAGGTWDHIQFREGDEWKGGARIAYKILPNTSLTMFIMGPSTEVRGGILFQPEKKE
jgi:hypothetical protein